MTSSSTRRTRASARRSPACAQAGTASTSTSWARPSSGEKEAAHRLAEVSRLVTREDVDYVSIKVSAVTGPHNPWGFDEVVAHGVHALAPLYRLARDNGTFLNLDMEDYKDLDLTIAVFTAILDQPDMRGYEAGIVLQAYLPDSLGALQRLQQWASARVDAGGSRIKVRIVKGANLSMERVDASIHGWELTHLALQTRPPTPTTSAVLSLGE